MNSKTIQIQYFANLREIRGVCSEKIQTCANTPEELYTELKLHHSFPAEIKHMRVAVNSEFSPWDRLLESEDEVVFIPPVAGG